MSPKFFPLFKRIVPVLCVLLLTITVGCEDKDAAPDHKADLKRAIAYINELETQNKNLNAKLEDLSDKFEGLDGDTEDGEIKDRFKTVVKENQALKEEKEGLLAELAELKQSAEESSGVVKQASEERQEIDDKIVELEAKNSALTERKAAYEEEIAGLRAQLKDQETLSKEIAHQKEKQAQAEKENAALALEVSDLRAQVEKMAQLEEELKSVKDENSALAQLNKAMKMQLANIQKMTVGDIEKEAPKE